MKTIGRFSLSELSFNRIMSAVKTRIKEMPHSISWKFSDNAKANKRIIEQYKDVHSGERCFIVANGPSLNITDLDLISDEISFGMNRIYLKFESSPFRPNYYISVNELVLEQFVEEISRLPFPKFINWNKRGLYGKPTDQMIYLKSKIVLNDFFQYNLTKPMVIGATVTYATLQLAYYMGFQEVILIGLDHNYAEKGIPNVTEKRSSNEDKSHFHPQYFPKGVKWQIPDLLRSEIEFQIARNVYESEGRRILDATIGGQCDIFKKVDYYSLF